MLLFDLIYVLVQDVSIQIQQRHLPDHLVPVMMKVTRKAMFVA